MVTTPTPTNQRVKEHCPYKIKKQKPSGLLHLEKMPVKVPGVQESQLLEVIGIAIPE